MIDETTLDNDGLKNNLYDKQAFSTDRDVLKTISHVNECEMFHFCSDEFFEIWRNNSGKPNYPPNEREEYGTSSFSSALERIDEDTSEMRSAANFRRLYNRFIGAHLHLWT